MRNRINLLLSVILLTIVSCTKDTDPTNLMPILTTGEAENITRHEATICGSIEIPQGTRLSQYGIYYSTDATMEMYEKIVVKDENKFSIELQNLLPGTTYYYCTYGRSMFSEVRGKLKSFETEPSKEPSVSDLFVFDIDENKFRVRTILIDDGGRDVEQMGLYWVEGEVTEPDASHNVVSVKYTTDSISVTLDELQPSQLYSVRAFAINADGVGYSATSYVTTLDKTFKPKLQKPVYTILSDNGVRISSRVTDDGGAPITLKGFCYSTTDKFPTCDDDSDMICIGDTLLKTITDIKKGKTYYVRAYARNKNGIAYSDTTSFVVTTIPTVGITSVSDITYTAASVSSTADSGGLELTEYGFVYSATNNIPTLDDTKAIETDGDFALSLENLTPGTKYYVRSYAINNKGTAYGAVTSFITAKTTRPSLGNIKVTNIQETKVSVSIPVTDNGGEEITEAGFYYDFGNTIPDESDNAMTATVSSGTISASLSELVSGGIYYIRAYAKNSNGTTYSEVHTFETVAQSLSVTSGDIIDLGLSVQWASCNLGAYSPQAYGSYYAWGETSTKTSFTYDNYSYTGTLTDISGTEYDAAYKRLGAGYRMPTQAEAEELVQKCTWTWGKLGTTKGHKVTGPNGNSIFLPAAGFYYVNDGERSFTKEFGFYWTATRVDNTAYELSFDIIEGDVFEAHSPATGCPIRAVYTPLNTGTTPDDGGTGGDSDEDSSGSSAIGDNKTITVSGVTFTMIPVEGGTFTMGATSEQGNDAYSGEKPAHQVTLSDYYIGETEVTQALWEAVMGNNPSYYTGNSNLPVECISWNDCQEFIEELNRLTGQTFRLPTEAEWEYAARGGNKSKGYKYAGGNTIGDVAWYSVSVYDVGSSSPDYGTRPVKSKQPNELGLYDMSGNVMEWCSDWYGDYSSTSQTNPAGPATGYYRVLRGGSLSFNARYCRVSSRYFDPPINRNYNYGLRLVLSVQK